MTPREVNIVIRGFGRRLKYLGLVLAQYIGPAVDVHAKGSPSRQMIRAAQRALEDF